MLFCKELRRKTALLFLLAGLILGLAPRLADAGGLADQLTALAKENGFSVVGLDRLNGEPVRMVDTGDAKTRLNALLQGYNFILTESRPGQIERVVITGEARKGGKTPSSSAVPTIRLGAHHQVDAVLIGPNAVPQTVRLMLDTGASTVVLPSSMIPALGFEAGQLAAGISQTASGQVRTRMGELASVSIGPVSAEHVPVSFIADKRLNGAMLLGMSFLNRFRVTIDDEHNEIVLLAK